MLGLVQVCGLSPCCEWRLSVTACGLLIAVAFLVTRAWALGAHAHTHTTNKEQCVTKTVCVTCDTQNIYQVRLCSLTEKSS